MIKVLIVDDEGFVRNGLIRNIPWRDLNIGTVEQSDDGINALTLAESFRPDIIVSDIRMPNMDGIEMARRLRLLLPDCKIIFMSAYADKANLIAAIDLKAVKFVEKPIDLDEIHQAISEAVQLCIADQSNNNLQQRYLESNEMVKENIALKLIAPEMSNWALVTHQMASFVNPSEIHGPVLVVTMKCKPLQNRLEIDLSFDKSNLFSELHRHLNQIGFTPFMAWKNEQIAVIILFGTERQFEVHNMKQIFEAFIGQPPRYFDLFVGIGLQANGLENIILSYQQSVVSLQQLFFIGYNKTASFQLGQYPTFHLDDGVEGEFSDLLIQRNKLGILQWLDRLLDNIRTCKESLANHIKNIYMQLFIKIFNVISNHKADFSLISEEKFFWELIQEIDTLDELHLLITRKVEMIFEDSSAGTIKQKMTNDILTEIHKNYSDNNLSIEMISSRLFLSQTYICTAFKKEFGQTINQYIIDYRIGKAKELLLNRAEKLSEIALQTGYRDHNYFTKSFKKHVGLTPSEHRERNLK